MGDLTAAAVATKAVAPAPLAGNRGLLQRKCACGNLTVAGAGCDSCRKETKSGAPGALQRAAAAPGSREEAPPVVDEALRSPGQPLDRATRAFFEPRFGRDFSRVPVRVAAQPGRDLRVGATDDPLEREAEKLSQRAVEQTGPAASESSLDFRHVLVHTGPVAARAAQAVNARAFTVGRHIVFDAGQYQPHNSYGQRLLAHELAHVLQQSTDRAEPGLRRAPAAPAKKATGVNFWFKVRVSAEMDSNQLLAEFLRQYLHLSNLAAAVKLRDDPKKGWKWVGPPQSVKPADVEKGYIYVLVNDPSATPGDPKAGAESKKQFQQLDPKDKEAINAETDRQYWQKTGDQTQGKIGTSKEDQQNARYWLALRDALLRQRRDIESLPPALRKFLFTEDSPTTVEPKDYATVLRIVRKLSKFSDTELEDYKARVNAQTTEWSALETSIDRYAGQRAQRHEEFKARERTKTKLYGLNELFRKYNEWQDLIKSNRFVPATDELGEPNPNKEFIEDRIEKREAELRLNLKRHGFETIADFKQTIDDYIAAFEKETVRVAFDVLAHYDHVLFEGEKKYRDAAKANAVAQALGKTQAKAHYEEAEREQEAADDIRMNPKAGWIGDQYERKQAHQTKATAAKTAAESEVKTAAADSLVNNTDFPREKLGRAAPGEVQSIMLEYIRDRRADVQKSRNNLTSNPDLIYTLPELWEGSKQVQGIEPGTIYAEIIDKQFDDRRWSVIVDKLVLAVVAIALGIVSFGTGTVAVIAAAASFGISAYQAYESFQEYQVGHAAYGAKLSSVDPSVAWVIVAAVGAGLDLGVAVSIFTKAGKAAQAVELFNASGDIVKLDKEMKAMVELGEIEERVRANVLKAAEVEKQYRQAVKGFAKASMGQLNVVVVAPAAFAEWVRVIYYASKKGIVSFEHFLLQLQKEKLISEAVLQAEELTKLKTVFEEAKVAVEDLTVHGKSLGLAENQVDGFVKLWAESKGSTLEEIKAQMKAWATQKQSGVPFGLKSLEQFEAFKATAVKELKKAGYSDAEAILQGSSVSGMSFLEKVPRLEPRDFDVAIASKQILNKLKSQGYKLESNPLHIGPLNDKQIKEVGLARMRGALEKASGEERQVNFYIFGNREAALGGIGGAQPPSMPLK